MTHIEFSAWLKGINAALNGQMPTPAIWAQVVQEAAKLANPPGPMIPYTPTPSPSTIPPWIYPWGTTCQGIIDTLGLAVHREHA